MEAKLRILKKGVSEGVWIKDILQDLCLLPSKGMTLYSDSKSVIAMVKNSVQHERTKHARVARDYIKRSIEGYLYKGHSGPPISSFGIQVGHD